MEHDGYLHASQSAQNERHPLPDQPNREDVPFLTDEFIEALTKTQAKAWLEIVHPAIKKTMSFQNRLEALRFFRDFGSQREF